MKVALISFFLWKLQNLFAIDNPARNAAIDDRQPVRLIMEIAFQINEGKADLAFFACFRQCDFKAKIRDGLAVCFWNRET